MDINQEQLKQYLELMKKCREGCGPVPEGFVYAGMEDFLLQHGQWFEPQAKPENIDWGAPKCCFANSLVLGVTRELRLVEGYAVAPIGFPVHHGWNLDDQGKVIDNTWRKPGLAYFGVEFSTGRADNASWFDDASILDNFSNPALYKQQWEGEDFSKKWKRSKGMKMMLHLAAINTSLQEVPNG